LVHILTEFVGRRIWFWVSWRSNHSRRRSAVLGSKILIFPKSNHFCQNFA